MPPLDAAGADDWVTAPTAPVQQTSAPAPAASGVDDWVTAPAAPPAQNQFQADVDAVGQGAVSGAGAVIAGAGRIAQAGQGPSAQKVLTALDLVDEGKNRDAYQALTGSERQQVAAYRGGSADDKAAMRSDLAQTITDYSQPNAVTRAGTAIEGAAPGMFPVDPANEGIQTGVGRMIGGAAPALAAGAVGGPAGILGAMATIGSQAYDGAYQDAISKGATHEQADDAAGKSAVAQAVTMTAPVSRLLQRVPMPLRDGLMKSLVNLGQNGIEFGSGNALGTFANNYVASQTYDPGRSLTQGTGDAALEGTIAGLIIPTVGGIVRGGGAGAGGAADAAADIMKAPSIDAAIATARKAVQEPAASGPAIEDAPTNVPLQPASRYGAAPGFIPPNTDPLPLPRIMALLNEDNRVAANRPAFVPPSADQPSIPMSWGQLFAQRPTTDVATTDPAIAAADQTAGAPVPQSVGAAASRDLTAPELLTERTRGQAQTDFEKSVMQTAEDRAGPQGEDHTVYVPDATRTLPAREFSVANAINEKTLRDTDPAYAEQYNTINSNSRGVVTDAYKNLSGDDRAIELAQDARDDATPAATDLFGKQKPVDAQPVVDAIDQILAGPAGKRSAVVSVLNDVRAKMYNSDGDLETLPDQLYGARQNITDKLKGKGSDTEASNARLAKGQLQDVLGVLDPIISQGAPGFTDYLSNFSQLSKPIDQMRFLQSKLLGPGKITDASGNVTFGGVQKLLEKIAVDKKASGANVAKSFSDDQLQSLIDMRNELAANDYRDRLAKTTGSDTTQKLSAASRIAGTAVKGAADAAIHLALLHTPAAGVGNAAYQFGVKPMIAARQARNAAATAAELKSRLISTTPAPQAAP